MMAVTMRQWRNLLFASRHNFFMLKKRGAQELERRGLARITQDAGRGAWSARITDAGSDLLETRCTTCEGYGRVDNHDCTACAGTGRVDPAPAEGETR